MKSHVRRPRLDGQGLGKASIAAAAGVSESSVRNMLRPAGSGGAAAGPAADPAAGGQVAAGEETAGGQQEALPVLPDPVARDAEQALARFGLLGEGAAPVFTPGARYPLKTIRRKLAAAGKAADLIMALARHHAAARPTALGFLYADGHARAYFGARQVQKMHVARLKFPGPATEETWVTDAGGDPVFMVIAEPSASLAGELRGLLPQLRQVVGEGRRVTVCFDRAAGHRRCSPTSRSRRSPGPAAPPAREGGSGEGPAARCAGRPGCPVPAAGVPRPGPLIHGPPR